MASGGQDKNNVNQETGRCFINTKLLLESQCSAAAALAQTYKSLADFPKLSRDVILSAEDLKSAHTLSCGLMTTFGGAFNHLVDTIIPLVLEATDMEDEELLRDLFNQVLEQTVTMKTQTNTIIQRYEELERTLGHQKTLINHHNRSALEENEKLETNIADCMSMIEQAKLEQKQLEDRLIIVEAEINDDNDKRKAISKQEDRVRQWLIPDPIPGIHNMFTPIIILFSAPTQTSEEQLQQLDEGETIARSAFKKKTEIQDEIDLKEIEICKLQGNIEKLGYPVQFGNSLGIGEAINYIGRAKQQFANVVLFWESMAAEVKHVKGNLSTNEDLMRLFKDVNKIISVKKLFHGYCKDCCVSREACLQYRTESGPRIKSQYNFHSMSFGSDAHDQNQTQKWKSH